MSITSTPHIIFPLRVRCHSCQRKSIIDVDLMSAWKRQKSSLVPTLGSVFRFQVKGRLQFMVSRQLCCHWWWWWQVRVPLCWVGIDRSTSCSANHSAADRGSTHTDVFKLELGTLQGYEASIHVDPTVPCVPR